MKIMTCKQLGGACDKEFKGDTFEQIAQQSQKHGMEMMQAGDKAHLEAMGEMRKLMSTPDAMKDWMDEKRKEFESLPDSN
jgi:hypothetical protein